MFLKSCGRAMRMLLQYLLSLPYCHSPLCSSGAGLWAQPHHLAGMYLWNPFAIISCVSGSLSPMENLFSLLAVYAAAVGNIPLAAFATACGAYLSLHPILLLVGTQILHKLAYK